MGDASVVQGKIKFYTNHGCPWAHRAHIILKELGLEYEEVLIDLGSPRPDWFLKLNPRGLVPTVVYSYPSLGKDIVVIESDLVVHFFLDQYSKESANIWPLLTSAEAVHARYRARYLADTYMNKINPFLFKILLVNGTEEETKAKVEDLVSIVKEHIEPLLHDAKPFCGGSSNMTLAEVLTAPFVLRLYDLSNGELLPESIPKKLAKLPNFSAWATAIRAKHSVTYIWDKEKACYETKERLSQMKQKYGAASK